MLRPTFNLRQIPHCRHICAITADNYYKLLEVPEKFTIDHDTLAQRFKQLQRQWHPDKFGRADASVRARAADMSARLNLAYETLQQPARRAQHLLEIMAPSKPVPQLDPAFLMWVVEIREQVVQARENPDIARKLREESEQALSSCISALRHAFDAGSLDRAAVETAKLKYLYRIEKALNE